MEIGPMLTKPKVIGYWVTRALLAAALRAGGGRVHGRARLPSLRPHHRGHLEATQRPRAAGPTPPAPKRVGLRRHLLRLHWRGRVPRLLRRYPRKNRDSARSTPDRRCVLGSSPAIAHLQVGLDASEESASGRFARRRRRARMRLGTGDRAAYLWPEAGPRHTFDEPVRLRRDPEAVRVSRPLRPSGGTLGRGPAFPLG